MEFTFEEQAAILDYKALHGRNWKSKLLKQWERGTDTGILRQLRNKLGPSGLINLKVYWFYHPNSEDIILERSH